VVHHLTDYVRVYKEQFNFLPESTIKVGMSANLLSNMTCETAILYISRLLSLFYNALR
jgi:hypothetical protein